MTVQDIKNLLEAVVMPAPEGKPDVMAQMKSYSASTYKYGGHVGFELFTQVPNYFEQHHISISHYAEQDEYWAYYNRAEGIKITKTEYLEISLLIEQFKAKIDEWDTNKLINLTNLIHASYKEEQESGAVQPQ